MTVTELERNTLEVYDEELPIAKLLWMGDIMKVHMYTDGYEFEVDSIDTALRLIKLRWERPKEWN